MTTTKRETALAGLETVMVTAFGQMDANQLSGKFIRDPEFAPDESADGMVIMRDGDPGTPEYTLSPLQYEWNHQVFAEISATGTGRKAVVDALLLQLDGALKIDRTLGGVVIDCRVMEGIAIDEIDGGEGVQVIRAATVHINLFYVSDSPIG